MPAPAHPVEVVAADERAVAIEVNPDLVPRAAARAAALIREGRERRDGYCVSPHVGPLSLLPE